MASGGRSLSDAQVLGDRPYRNAGDVVAAWRSALSISHQDEIVGDRVGRVFGDGASHRFLLWSEAPGDSLARATVRALIETLDVSLGDLARAVEAQERAQ